MNNPFRYATKNQWGDCIEIEQHRHERSNVVLSVMDRDGIGNHDKQCVILTRRDLTEIIAGLTAIRDAMPEEPR